MQHNTLPHNLPNSYSQILTIISVGEGFIVTAYCYVPTGGISGYRLPLVIRMIIFATPPHPQK
jgi:hypothetical protein